MSLILPLIFKLAVTSFAEAPHPLRDTSMVAGCIIEAKTGKVVWSRDKDTPRYPASTTKIMTCLLMLENYGPEDIITAPKDVDKVRESSMNLKPFERVRVKNMAYALMLRSANDGCYAIAMQMDGSVKKFAERMNNRAKEIGCEHTHFDNPNGLNDKNHTISPYDLCLIAREAMKRPDFREVVKTEKKIIDRSINTKDRLMVSRNKYLWKDPSADGIKTGWTIPAGHTYVGSATRNGTEFIDSLMNAPHWMDDHQKMLTWAFDNYETKLIQNAGPIKFPNLKVAAELRDDVYACVNKNRDRVESLFVPATGSHTFKKGDVVGTLDVTDGDGYTQHIPVYATEDQPDGAYAAAAAISPGGTMGLTLFAVIGTLAAGTIIYRGIIRAQSRI
ncbi:MAG: D-alanyl-D-alanine carboxypeptidase [Armatimonadetes bacterium]|nr:hypothetical protein [Armatimonadota bacterium]MBS1701636.1 D-alanyl-D-alanine carboxypeptidase [Armatimonadota bacterium]MBS1727299.1 D-alanyl-D-alanine carboxypeptidase [Armatimonadota bacterium]